MDDEILFIGRRLFYNLSTGEILLDAGERAGYVRRTTGRKIIRTSTPRSMV